MRGAFLAALLLAAPAWAVSPPAVEGAAGMVVSSQHLASEAGVAMLQAGGNAVDAAVAVGYALAVTEPCCGNIGGGGFMTIHLADGRDVFLDFRETAPAAATRDMYLGADGNPVPGASLVGWKSVGVPGSVAGLEHARAQRSRQPLLLALLDLDHFKAVNDTHGHAAGDVALQSFAQTVHGCVRASDLLARWGGEEFLLLMANTHPADGTRLLERVRATVAATPVALPGGTQLSLTVSVGLAELAPGESTAALLQRADAALYGAKRLGRNRVLLAH